MLIFIKILLLATILNTVSTISKPSFYIDYNANTFTKDGLPFQYVSGSIHSYRVPREYWQDRLNKIKALGLNAVQIYIFWNEHELNQGEYDFKGQKNVFEFINLAHKAGLLVILRPGPYICGEHEYGGLPWWLLSGDTSKVVPRSSEYAYMKAVSRWLRELLPRVVPYLYENNGPIISIQVENEYGSYSACDRKYTKNLLELFRNYLGDNVLLFTTDGNSIAYLRCGVIDGAYATVDFGSGTNITEAFNVQRIYSPKGPLVNSEYYTGWLDYWGSPHSKVNTKSVIQTFEEMMFQGANVNLYMVHGGTNFGFSNGADPIFSIQPTSYDYDAPISEAGDITNKYLALRESISKFIKTPNMKIPANQTKTAYGKVKMLWKASLPEVISNLSDTCIETNYPETFEKLGQGYGFIMYSTILENFNSSVNVSIPGIRDRGYLMIDKELLGIVDRTTQTNLTINLTNIKNAYLHIIVENMGRLNYGSNMLDKKGLNSNVYINGNAIIGWKTCLTNNFVPYFQTTKPFTLIERYKKNKFKITKQEDFKIPSVYIGEFKVEENHSTFLKMNKFTKGIAIIGTEKVYTNLGRYWPNKGPQVTLYTPGCFLEPNSYNQIILIEFEGSSCGSMEDCYVEFIDYPIIDSK